MSILGRGSCVSVVCAAALLWGALAHADVRLAPLRYSSAPLANQGVTTSWDGRILIYGTNSGSDPSKDPFTPWKVVVFRPELLKRDPARPSRPDFHLGKSPSDLLQSLGDPLSSSTKSLYDVIRVGSGSREKGVERINELLSRARLTATSAPAYLSKPVPLGEAIEGEELPYPFQHSSLAIVPEPRRVSSTGTITGNLENPIHRVSGTQVTDIYEMFIFAQDDDDKTTCAKNVGTLGASLRMGRLKARITVNYPNGYAGEGVNISTTIMEKWKGLMRKDGEPLCARHPSVTADGRLMFFEDGKFISYSYNQSPTVNGWSTPKDLTRLYEDRSVLLAGVSVGQRYPIAARPLTDALGSRLRSAEGEALLPDGSPMPRKICVKGKCTTTDLHSFQGGYPWITPDGTDLVYSGVQAWELSDKGAAPGTPTDGAARSAASIIGSNTGWAERLIDGSFNLNRASQKLASELCLDYVGDPNCQKNSMSDAEYASAIVTVNRALGLYTRIRTFSPGLNPSMWGPYAEAPRFAIPYRQAGVSLPLFGANSGTYDEVSFDAFRDANYVFYLPMGELIDRRATEERDGWYETYYHPGRTPDISANSRLFSGGVRGRIVGELLDARFPMEFDGRDETVGVSGQAIYFAAKSAIQVDYAGSERTLGSEVTAQFWIKRKAEVAASILRIPGVLDVSQGPKGQVRATFSFADSTQATLITQSTALARLEQWNHVALVYSRSGRFARVYANGDVVAEQLFATPIALAADTTQKLRAGPATTQTGAAAIYLLDELALSNTARTEQEIRHAAFFLREENAIRSLEGLPKGVQVPLGLRAEDLKIPVGTPLTQPLIVAGRKVFTDRNLSSTGAVSCAVCHTPSKGFTDGRTVAKGVGLGTRNSPSIVNRAFSTHQFLDGRAPSVRAQALQPFFNPLEMGLKDEAELVQKLSLPASQETRSALDAAVQGGLTPANTIATVRAALTAFVLTRFVGDSLIDRFEAGVGQESGAPVILSDGQLRGRALFRGKARCTACHFGSNYSDERFHATVLSETSDPGRFLVSKNPRDRQAFKTPTLRDVARTAPYLHNGSIATLKEVVHRYNQGGGTPPEGVTKDPEIQPLGLTDDEENDLVLFLEALSTEGSLEP